jgi:hypothetical protein
MPRITETLNKIFSDWIDLYKRAAVPLFIDIAKVELLNFLVIGVLFLFTIAAVFLLGISFTTSFSALSSSILPLFFIAFIVFIVFVSFAIGSIKFNVIDDKANNRETNIVEKLRENFVPVVLYMLLTSIIYLVLLSPLILAFIFGGGLRNLAALCLFLILIILAVLLFVFFAQFSFYELVINRRGVIESFKQSFSLVKSNIITVFVFDIIDIIISSLVVLPFSLIGEIVGVVLFSVPSLSSLLLHFIFSVIYYTIVSIVTTFILQPLFYFFWKNISMLK